MTVAADDIIPVTPLLAKEVVGYCKYCRLHCYVRSLMAFVLLGRQRYYIKETERLLTNINTVGGNNYDKISN